MEKIKLDKEDAAKLNDIKGRRYAMYEDMNHKALKSYDEEQKWWESMVEKHKLDEKNVFGITVNDEGVFISQTPPAVEPAVEPEIVK